jgi:tetratricopeptide (TPR) repeat protein
MRDCRVGIGLALLVLTGCSKQPSGASGTLRAEAQYVDTAGCATCHRDIVEVFAKTGMGRSFSPAEVVTGKLHHAASDRYYEIGEGKMRRYQVGPSGAQVNRIEKSIDFVIGSGNHAQTFATRNADGSLSELPVSWYSSGGGRWGMSPGYDRPDQEDFRRRVPEDCLFCHNAYPRSGVPYPSGIDCQRCHGPASDHKGLVNPAKLSRERRMDVCEQCHLEPTSMAPPSVIRRPGRRPFSYKPGEKLTDYAVYFEAEIGDRLEVAHQGYRLRKSACFLKSEMTCITCHDPHRVQTVSHYIEVCRSCHNNAKNAHYTGEKCLDCHMWKRATDDAPLVVMTDHYIQRRKPPSFVTGTATARKPYFPDQDPGQQYYRKGLDASKTGNLTAAIHLFRQAIQSGDNAAESRREVGAALLLSGNAIGAIDELQSLQDDPVALTNLGNAYLQTERIEEAKRVLANAPEEPDANNLLGLAFLKSADTASAETAFRKALNLQPDLAEANSNLATLLAGRRAWGEAAWYFGKAVAANPKNAEFRHSYGLMLAMMRDYSKARAQLEEALKLAPGSADIRAELEDLRRSMR